MKHPQMKPVATRQGEPLGAPRDVPGPECGAQGALPRPGDIPTDAPRGAPVPVAPARPPSQAGDVGAEQEKSRVRRVLRELVLLRLLRRKNRRVARLHALALRCWKALRARRAAALQPAPAGERDLLPEPAEDTANSPVGDTERGADVAMDPGAATGAGTAEASERDLLGALPQQVLVPAPKVLCRPSAQRWVKPCCTRSCSGSLGHALAGRPPP